MERHPASPWPPLLAAVALEVTATLSLRAAEGLTHPAWLILVVAGYAGSLALLAVVLDRRMPVGVAYGIWSAIGVAATAVLGAVVFGEQLSVVGIGGIAVIIVGVLLVELGHRATSAAGARKEGRA
ncbi:MULTISPECIES: multidrug efflux SMR transporter [Microbacterium]|uniref:DMT family transporter n=1 Tax=Microbacterium TaxID=33882 RepID=UPI00278ACA20|nr:MULTISPECIES: multidrug efflux SMR transporter [Microbacterium]MDQ1075181.1 small multidrug resistance pump [Microbacterium sp. SORGH_AS_0969]MDQ1115411.1 small multidrug resistance pump [Microbacterium testaceum]